MIDKLDGLSEVLWYLFLFQYVSVPELEFSVDDLWGTEVELGGVEVAG